MSLILFINVIANTQVVFIKYDVCPESFHSFDHLKNWLFDITKQLIRGGITVHEEILFNALLTCL